MEKKYQIFISSTFTDLIEPRNKVRDAILSMMQFPIGMEMFSAADEEQWEIIQDTIDSSDYYILIVGHRYGSVIENGEHAGISYTEKEFRYAKEKGIPILAFILSDDAEVKKTDIESDSEKSKKLEKFKVDVSTGRIVEWWKTPDELALKVTAALHKQMDRKKRPGWIRGDSFDIEASHAEILRLNKTVRSLQEENASLKAQIVERRPKLGIEFILDEMKEEDKQKGSEDEKSVSEECRSHGGLVLMMTENNMQIKLAPIDVENYRNLYEPLDESYVEAYLKSYVSEEALNQYNNALPDKQEVDQYIAELGEYQRVCKGGVAFTLQVFNDGTAKATDVRAFIDFPEEFRLLEISDVEDIEEPKAPKLPKNPIEEAEQEYARRINPAVAQAYRMSNYVPYDFSRNIGALRVLDSKLMISDNNSLNQSLVVEEHGIVAEAKQIPHRDLEWFDGIYIVPIQKGKFQVKISLMCSEYIEPEVKYLDIEVV